VGALLGSSLAMASSMPRLVPETKAFLPPKSSVERRAQSRLDFDQHRWSFYRTLF
jgi:hypothetical protein